MNKLLPLFPLQLVAFPGNAIPLHIFEPRYREMVGAAARDGSEFGIVLAKDDGIAGTGCTVVVESVLERHADGRFDVMTRGRRRFLIRALNEEKPYLRGEVEFFEDNVAEDVPDETRSRAVMAYSLLVEKPEVEVYQPGLSFRIVHAIRDGDFQLRMQRSRSEVERLLMFADFVGEYIERREYRERMKQAAPRNGSGHKPMIM